MPLVDGQEAISGGVEGQVTGGSIEGQTAWGETYPGQTVNYDGPEDQVKGDGFEGQETYRPYSEQFPERDTDYEPFASSGQPPQTSLPMGARGYGGSNRHSIPING